MLVPQIKARTKAEALARFGLTPGDVRRAMATFVKGLKVGEVYVEQKTYDVVVWGDERVRTDLDALRSIWLNVPTGGVVRLGDVMELRIAPTPKFVSTKTIRGDWM